MDFASFEVTKPTTPKKKNLVGDLGFGQFGRGVARNDAGYDSALFFCTGNEVFAFRSSGIISHASKATAYEFYIVEEILPAGTEIKITL